MTMPSTEDRSPARVVDASVHPFFRSNQELRDYLPEGFKARGYPDVESSWYQAPRGDYHSELYGDGYPGSDPETVAHHLFEESGVDVAVLNPLTRGNIPDYVLNSVICAATNEWLADRWLSSSSSFRGTIRVNPEDAAASVAEIERWAKDPRMVQVGVPLQSREPYGKPQFRPIWEAAAQHGLPVAVRTTGGTGVEFPPTPTGHALTYPHYAAYAPLNFFVHLANLIIEGVFQDMPDLVFIFADGGADILTPMMWRLDSQWLAVRDHTPWVTEYPSSYLRRHARFCTRSIEGPFNAAMAQPWFEQTEKEELMVYGSHYPFWYWQKPEEIPEGLSGEQREKLLGGNAAALYKHDSATTVELPA
jgi:predicted TIM-barrel fold metal-dependent hydrolase